MKVFITDDKTCFSSKHNKIRQMYLSGRARSEDNLDTSPCSACRTLGWVNQDFSQWLQEAGMRYRIGKGGMSARKPAKAKRQMCFSDIKSSSETLLVCFPISHGAEILENAIRMQTYTQCSYREFFTSSSSSRNISKHTHKEMPWAARTEAVIQKIFPQPTLLHIFTKQGKNTTGAAQDRVLGNTKTFTRI